MGRITIVGTGWTIGQLTLEAIECLKEADRVILHTERSGCAEWLKTNNIPFESLDEFYETCEDFDEHAQAAAEAVLKAAETTNVVYGVLDVRDHSCVILTSAGKKEVRVIAGPPVEGALLAFVNGGAQTLEASDWENFKLKAYQDCLIREIDNRELASEVKLRLMETYPEECGIWLTIGEEAPMKIPLYNLDRHEGFDHRTCALIPAQRDLMALERYDFEHLNEIIQFLCAPGGCPWDRAQTHETLRTCMLEEAYEVIDAIDEGSPEHLYEELGDMLLQIIMHTEIGRKYGEFDISDVTTAISEKMIRRHTHIFGADQAEDPEQVMDLWNKNKMESRGQKTQSEAMKSITRTLPAFLRAIKVMKRSADVNLCESQAREALNHAAEMLTKVTDETSLGEALMKLSDALRLMEIDPEIALNQAINRYIDQFEKMEQKCDADGVDLHTVAPEILRKYWDLVKL